METAIFATVHMSKSENFLKGVIYGIIYGSVIGAIEGDTRRFLDLTQE